MYDSIKKHIPKKITAMLLAVGFLFISGCGAKPSFIGNAGKNKGFEQVEGEKAALENENLRLEIDTSDGNIAVTELGSGKTYYSTDPSGVSNSWVNGPTRMRFLSQLSLNVIDKYGTLSSVDSSRSAVRENGFLVRQSDSVLQAVYRFMEYKIEITVEYRLDGDRLAVSIPVNRIRCDGTYTLADINLLPYFAAAGPDEKGQLLIPSGSGALINFGSGSGGTISDEVYGTDPMRLADYKTETGALIALPMFAYMYETRGSAVMAYIEKGASLATLNANASGGEIGATAASFSFNYHPYALVNPLNTQTQTVKYNMPTSERSDIDEFSVSYRFFGEKKTYFDIAGAVKERLSAEMTDSAGDTDKHPVYIEMIMGINKTVYTLGLPHKACYPLTTVSSAFEVCEELGTESIYMVLNGTDSDGAYGGKIDTDFSVNSNIGTLKEYKELEKKLSENGGRLYGVTEHTRFTRSTLRFPAISAAAKSVNGKNVKVYTYRNGDGQKNQDITPLNLLKYSEIGKSAAAVVDSALKKGISRLAPFSISNTPYTCNSDYGDRSKTHNSFVEAARKYTESGIELMLKAPDAEMLTYANAVYAAPTASSGARIFDEDIPFLQLVLNGIVSYSVAPLNENGNSRLSMLKALESSASLAYTLYTADCEETENTAAAQLSSSQFSAQKSKIKENIRGYNAAVESLGAIITGHRVISPGVHITEYGKNSIVINYNDSQVEYGGKTIPKMSYALFKEGEKLE